jgi:hypothetical protein
MFQQERKPVQETGHPHPVFCAIATYRPFCRRNVRFFSKPPFWANTKRLSEKLHSSLPTPITELLDYEEFCGLDTAALVTSGV